MIRLVALLPFLFCLCDLRGIAWCQCPPREDVIISHVQQLGSNRFAERREATKRLLAIGGPALPAIRKNLSASDPEVRYRAEKLVAEIEQQLRNEELTRAPNIRFVFDRTPLNAAVAEVAKKTGLPLYLDPKVARQAPATISLDTGDMPYWQAIERFFEVSGLREQPFPVVAERINSDIPLQVEIPNNGLVPLRFVDPELRVVPASLQRGIIHLGLGPVTPSACDRIVRIRALPREHAGSFICGTNQIALSLNAIPCAGCAWQGMINVDIHNAVDDLGRPLNQVAQESQITNSSSGGLFVQGGQILLNAPAVVTTDPSSDVAYPTPTPFDLPVVLQTRDDRATTLRELSGVLTARIISPYEPVVSLNNLTRANPDEVAQSEGFRLAILERKNAGSGFLVVRVRVEAPPINQQTIFPVRMGARVAQPFIRLSQMSSTASQLLVVDSTGKPLTGITSSLLISQYLPDGSTCSEWQLSINTQTTGNGAPVQLVLRVRRPTDVSIPFALKNVPLPR